MKKASKPTGAKKPAEKRPIQKQPLTRPVKPKKAQGGTGLAQVVAQLGKSAEKLAQAADRLAEATARLSVTREARHEIIKTEGESTPDSAASPLEFEAADVNDSE